MKKIIFAGLLSVLVSASFGQLKVTQDGKVGIGITSTPLSKLAVGSVGDPNVRFMFEGDKTAMHINGLGLAGGFSASLYVSGVVASSSTGDRGISCCVSRPNPGNNGRALGVCGIAGNASTNYNYGVLGALTGSNNGAGVLGCVSEIWYDIPVVGRFAGYFAGDVKVTGTINGTVVGSSDIRLKQNVMELGASGRDKDGVLKRIAGLKPIEYNFKQVYYDLRSDTLQSPVGHFDENSQTFQKKHYGLIAQDLQEIYPDLVYENDNGYLSINYTEIIPLLIQSIKELKEEVDVLSSAFVTARSATPNDILAETPRAVLYQNAPNPFSVRTEIKFELPNDAKNSSIMIFNMQGVLMKQIQIQRQQKSVIINGSELTAGMYLYSLIVDGKEVDTKRMILTK